MDVSSASEDKRLWIGNLDPRVTEYQLLKLLQKYGDIEKFDLIFHRTGPLAGQPRGYAFVTYKSKGDAVLAKNSLNNQPVGTRSVVVSWANSITVEQIEKPKPQIVIPALAMSKEEKKSDPVHQIQAIEAKLKLMERRREEELKINDTVATKTPIISQYQYNKRTNVKTSFNRYSSKKNDRLPRPYSKNKR